MAVNAAFIAPGLPITVGTGIPAFEQLKEDYLNL